MAELEAGIPNATRVDIAFDFHIINIDATTDDVTVAAGTGWTLVGNMVVTETISGHFRASQDWCRYLDAVSNWLIANGLRPCFHTETSMNVVLVHPIHGAKVAIDATEIENDELAGWTRYEPVTPVEDSAPC